MSRAPAGSGRTARLLDAIERAGNALPDPVLLFVLLLGTVWVLSALLAGVDFDAVDPRSAAGEALLVKSQLTGDALVTQLAGSVKSFTDFPPLGIVLVALLGVGVAEQSGLVSAGLRWFLAVTPRVLLTPMLILVGQLSHTASDAGFVLVIPLGGALFLAAGRHPLAGIAAAFAGVSGGFGANILISPLDPMLQSFTQAAAGVVEPGRLVSPLCNWAFCAASSVLIVLLGWLVTERVVERRLAHVEVDGDEDHKELGPLVAGERRGLVVALVTVLAAGGLLAAVSAPQGSPFRSPTDGSLTSPDAPLMRSIVPLIFLFGLAPGIAYGYATRSFRGHRDVIQGMARAIEPMAYYLVLAFFAAQFLTAFTSSNLGPLLAVKGAQGLKALDMPDAATLAGTVVFVAVINVFVFSASAKWALLAPILVPMLMQVGISPELTQAAYRIGDSTTNIVSPIMVYFPLVVVYCRRYVTRAGIGTLATTMLPYSAAFLVVWTAFLVLWWKVLDLPLGVGAP